MDFPTISVQASLPGASPETMAATVATPLERTLGRIAGVTEITSSSSLGNTRVTLQFDLDRNIDGAARDVQAAIQAARALLPSGLPAMPTYRKVNPADSPIMILSLTSKTLSPGQMYDAASTVLAQRLSQVDGIGQVNIGGGALPAVRVELNPTALNHNGLSLDNVRTAIVASNAYRPLGTLEAGDRHWQLGTNDQGRTAADFRPLILRYVNGAAVRLGDVAEVNDSVENVRTFGASNSRPAVLLILYRQPGANIIETVDQVRALLPRLSASIPSAIDLEVVMDRTPTIRGSLRGVQQTLSIAVGLVILVVFLFLRRVRAALIPSIAVPVSLIGTCAVMYLAGYSIDNLSLMALTVATGFVVDDAIVVTENISRHLEAGKQPFAAALAGVREIGFTVVSISLSLVAVFVPILFMGGIVGRLFREFAVTLTASILVSMVVSLTLTPMLCAHLLKPDTRVAATGRLARWSGRLVRRLKRGYRTSLAWSLRHSALMLVLLGLTIALNVHLYATIAKGFFPSQDTGRIIGNVRADQSISFQAMRQKMLKLMAIVQHDPAVETVVGFTGGGQSNSGFMFVTLKPLRERKLSADKVVARLRGKLAHVPGASLILNPAQDVRIGGRQSEATYQYTLQADHLTDLREWEPRILRALMAMPELTDVSSDQQNKGVQTRLVFDRDRMASLGLTMGAVDSTLNSAFGQRQVSVIYNPLNQYRVVMELAPAWLSSPESLRCDLVQHARRRPGGLERYRPRRDDQHAAGGESPGHLPGQHPQLQPATGRHAGRRVRRHRPHPGENRRAHRRPWRFPGHRQGLPGFAQQPAAADPGGAGHHLHCAGRAVREPDPSDHHPLHAALGGRRRAAGADGFQYAVRCHRPDRHHPADRHRQEERHPDDRLRHRPATPGRQRAARHLPRRADALPADHDDHPGRHFRRGAAGAG